MWPRSRGEAGRVRDPDWDRHCSELAVEAIRERTGRDVWAELGGCPRSWAEAAALYKREGVRNLDELVTKVLGPPLESVNHAFRGDICMVDGALGVCRGEWVECLDRMQPLYRATTAWRVTGRP